jgi:geranylgeranyl diphosphate synthase type II
MIIPNWYDERRKFIEDALERYLINYFNSEWIFLWKVDNKWLNVFKEACLYSVEGWKKLRAILALEFYLSLKNIDFEEISYDDDIIKYCIAIELVHSFSLIHDDLPCMDNDSLRRGKETVWKKFGEYQAVLAWDFLNTLAFELLSTIQGPKLSIQLTNLLSRSTWFHWMIWWQIDDMFFEGHPKSMWMSDLLKLHNRKTWALIRASVQWWILCSEKIQNIHKLSHFGEKLWLAFQIKDDILDVEWSVKETGKSVWWEEKGFVFFLWIKEAKLYLAKTIWECKEITKALNSEKIQFLINFVETRSK